MRQGAWGWCTGMTQRDGMGKEVGDGFRMGNTCTPVVERKKLKDTLKYLLTNKLAMVYS